MKIAILASHEGTTLQALIDACESGELDATVSLVISNNSRSGALQRARNHNIRALHISSQTHEDVDEAICNALSEAKVAYVFLAGYMKKIGPETLFLYDGRILNTHPSLLPKYGGEAFYGSRIHEEVYKNRETETGVTIHLVDENYDTGKIIAQRVVPIDYAVDDINSIEDKVKTAEKRLVIDTFKNLKRG